MISRVLSSFCHVLFYQWMRLLLVLQLEMDWQAYRLSLTELQKIDLQTQYRSICEIFCNSVRLNL